MPRERRTAAKFKGDPDGPGELKNCGQPESPSSKKRRTVNTPNHASPALQDLIPPQPLTGFGETIVASNPFDDTIPASAATTVPNMPVSGLTHMTGPPMHNKPVPISSGKIYPPDQCMVFNPQNPNAPPIYPCGICHKEVHDNDQGILCESGCNFWFHRICTGLSDAAFHLLTAEVYAEWVCDKCLSTKNIPLVKFKP
ncbi:LOW QUALITY PROTEIN: protein pygopus-like [Uloborus diversus]|uniref:LOW QUALITY PROTEIN: protein pygopus-like n=1 Tax=Uloborus diversus TaxID=327109 RepID=UPI00240A1C77|nr:LOW QUALITY PROTEIN: protein pygopus-like [Uloborus diversus]